MVFVEFVVEFVGLVMVVDALGLATGKIQVSLAYPLMESWSHLRAFILAESLDLSRYPATTG